MEIKNFSAGPAMLPRVALERAGQELLDFMGTGLSVAEVSHRSPEYEMVHQQARRLFRALMQVPDTHEVLLMQGGTRLHFGLVPMNLLNGPDDIGEYIVTGWWSRVAYQEAAIVRNVRIASDAVCSNGRYETLPTTDEINLSPQARYLHLCSNNTVVGTQWSQWPDLGELPLVIDMTSDILSRAVDWRRIGLAYAGTQKNLGPAGVVVVVIRRDLLETEAVGIPKAMRYAAHAAKDSLLYTPSSFSVLTMQLVLEHAREIGGIAVLEANNQKKAALLYSTLDKYPETYSLAGDATCRSRMNVVFTIPDNAQEGATRQFLAEAERRGMRGLKGHRSQGGVRASIYNWVPYSHVEALTELLEDFATSDTMRASRSRSGPTRRDIPLKVEYTHEGRRQSSYIKDLGIGGLQLPAALPKGKRLELRLSFLGLLEHLNVEAIVRWSNPESDDGKAQSGLQFIELSPAAEEWLSSLLTTLSAARSSGALSVLLLESNAFLGKVYAREVHNWAEIQGASVQLTLVDNTEALFLQLEHKGADLIIVDLDDLSDAATNTLRMLRKRLGPDFPLIFLSSSLEVEQLNNERDESLLALSKPLDFGQLMETIRKLRVAELDSIKTPER